MSAVAKRTAGLPTKFKLQEAKESSKGSALVEIREKIGLSQREANEIAWDRIIWNQIAGGLILMGLEREERARRDLSASHDVTQSQYEAAISGAGINRMTAHRWQTMAWAAACSRKLAEDDPASNTAEQENGP